jgi:primosomal protein N' (replication factor Y)
MKTELKNGNTGSISSVLRRELEINIENGQQSILFINRRGTSPIVSCGECGYTFQCAHCSISLTYHKFGERLVCHYCGYFRKLPQACDDCGGKLKFIGAGTQKIEAELGEILPEAKIIRMDADSVTRKNSHGRLLSDFRENNAHILLGTQMVTKGLDFENVTLVGVISADASLYMGDYRAHERTFSLITQVVGRSGRGDKPGRAIIQTFTPSHEVIALSSKQDYDGFYDREIAIRSVQNSPPINDLLIISASSLNEQNVLVSCKIIRDSLMGYFSHHPDVRILGPAPAPVFKVNNKFRYRLFVSCRNTKRVRETIAHTLREFSRGKFGKKVSVFVDCEP